VIAKCQEVRRKALKYAIFKLSTDLSEIVVDRTGTDSDWDSFLTGLPESEPRYVLYDFEYAHAGRLGYVFLQRSFLFSFH
jgi:cofilin